MKERKKKRGRRERCVQGELAFPLGWGGARKGAGRKKSENSGVSHGRRDDFRESHPVHVTMKLLPDLPSLRKPENFLPVLKMFEAAQKETFRIVHFTVQGNHMHLLIEAAGKDALARGMTGLAVRISKGLNKLWERRGTLFADRYHSRVLTKPTEVRNVLDYIFKNRRKHSGQKSVQLFDSCSSAMLFDGWKEMEARELVGDYRPIVEARSWLVREGWLKAGGKLSVRTSPGSKRKTATR
jgi:REP element-mobilizing transposase RayT